MQDQLLTCENCGNPFVYSVYEQIQNSKKLSTGLINQTPTNQPSTIYDPQSNQPKYCPICTSIKASEQKHPSKPQKAS